MRSAVLISLALGLWLRSAALGAPLAVPAPMPAAASAPAAPRSGGEPNPPASVAPPEPPAPPPSAAVQTLRAQAGQLAQVQHWAQALSIMDQALQTARRLEDAAGEAVCQRGRAIILGQTQRPDEARAAWQAAAPAWARAGDGPGQVEALGEAALLTADAKAAAELESRAIALAGMERKRPLAAARALLQLGEVAYERRQLLPARHFWTAAQGRLGTLAPVSLDMAASLSGLGIVARSQGDLAGARQDSEQALEIAAKLAPGSLGMAGALSNVAGVAYTQGDLPAAKRYYEQALAIQQKLAPGSMAVAGRLGNLGLVAQSQGDLAAAKQYHQQALAIQQKLAPGSLEVANSLNNLGNVAHAQGDLPAAKQYHQQALAIQQKLAPGSLEVANSLGNLGLVARSQGDLAGARQYHEQALAILQKLAPGSPGVAATLDNLGTVAVSQGDPAGAKRYYEQALAIEQRLAPGSLDVAGSLNNLAGVAYTQGELARAKQYFEQALAIQQNLAPGSLDVTNSLSNLGSVALSQGDLAAAKQYYEQALAIEQKLAPSSLAVAGTLDNLGLVAQSQGDLAGAKQYHQQALAIQQKLAPRSLDVADSLNNLGNVAYAQGNLAAARRYYQGTLTIREKLAPGSLDVADSLNNLGSAAAHQGDQTAAKQYFEQALAIAEKLAPGSLKLATLLSNLGNVDEQQRQWPEAERATRQAWQIAQQQAGAVGADEARQAFDASTAVYAAHLLGVQLARGKPQAAFATLEEGRAQALRQLLLQRRLSPRGVPPPLWGAYQQALTAQNQAEQALSRAGATELRARAARLEAEQTRAAPAALTGLREAARAAQQQLETAQAGYLRDREAVAQRWSEVEKRAPRLFAPSFTLTQGARALPPGTLFLAFAVGRHQTWLFLLQRGHSGRPGLRTVSIALDAAALQRQVRHLRAAFVTPDLDPTSPARALYTALFPPAARPLIQRARRLLISPDGPLWELPFAALVINRNGPPRYLGLEKPITFTPSLTLFAQAEHSRPARPRGRLTAVVAAPFCLEGGSQMAALPGPGGGAEGERGVLVRLDGAPRLLPSSGAEATQIGRLYGVRPLLGRAATEAAVRRQLVGAMMVHLATHGYVHPLRAMDSGVLLSPPRREPAAGRDENDGVLQAWEIAELSLPAELVVLSACDSGRGENVRSEGIVGLVRALQVAGARSVVASQWAVSDASTATLMVAFHRRLRAGAAKDEALRQAMRLVARRRETSSPYYWAPFFLVGDPSNSGLARTPSPGHGSERVLQKAAASKNGL